MCCCTRKTNIFIDIYMGHSYTNVTLWWMQVNVMCSLSTGKVVNLISVFFLLLKPQSCSPVFVKRFECRLVNVTWILETIWSLIKTGNPLDLFVFVCLFGGFFYFRNCSNSYAVLLNTTQLCIICHCQTNPLLYNTILSEVGRKNVLK